MASKSHPISKWRISREFLYPLIFTEISGDLRGFGRVQGSLGNQGNSVRFCVALNRNSVGIPGGIGGNAGVFGEDLGLGWFGAILGSREAFAPFAISTLKIAVPGKSTLWTNTGQDRNFQRTLSAIGPYKFWGKFIWTNHWSIPFPGEIRMDQWSWKFF